MTTYLVSCDHVSADFRLDDVPFVVNGMPRRGSGRVGHREAAHGEPEEFWASISRFGCGRSHRTATAAIRDLLAANGCTDIDIELVDEAAAQEAMEAALAKALAEQDAAATRAAQEAIAR